MCTDRVCNFRCYKFLGQGDNIPQQIFFQKINFICASFTNTNASPGTAMFWSPGHFDNQLPKVPKLPLSPLKSTVTKRAYPLFFPTKGILYFFTSILTTAKYHSLMKIANIGRHTSQPTQSYLKIFEKKVSYRAHEISIEFVWDHVHRKIQYLLY